MKTASPVNILLVDDQPAKLLAYEAILADLGESLIRANSGTEALEHLLKRDIAVVLLDACMPELDGFELASLIRRHPRFQKTAIILVSGVLVEDVDRLKGYDSGAVDYVSVPIVPEILRAKVSVFVELYRKTEELKRLNQELERRVAERTTEIQDLLKHTEEARQEAERANQLKDEFLALLSHELRTPLNAITGWAHMLREEGLDPETRAKAVETINRNALLQTRLISDLLDVSRIVFGKLRLDRRPVELSSVIEAAVDAVRPAAEDKHIQVDATVASDLEPVAGDPARLQQVVSNLLSNAIKFTPANGHVQIRVQKAGAQAELTVEDDGPGIRSDLLPHIFERFRQGDSSTTRAHQGLGLGLAIVRHLVEMHGGSVRAANRIDRPGARFTVLFPMSSAFVEAFSSRREGPVAPTQAGIWRPSSSLLRGTRILVVDDEADAREVTARILEQCGAELTAAATAGEALEVLQREQPDLLVADIEMPEEDGYSLIRKIRALPSRRGGQTPAVALTAHASTSDCLRILDAGFNQHVPKPVHAPELVNVLATLTRLDEASQETATLGQPVPGGNT